MNTRTEDATRLTATYDAWLNAADSFARLTYNTPLHHMLPTDYRGLYQTGYSASQAAALSMRDHKAHP